MEWILTWPFGNYVSKIIFISNQQYSCTIKMCFYGSPLLSLIKHKTISKSQTHYWLLSFVCLIIEKEEICCVCLCFPITDDEIGWKDSTRFWWRKRGWMMSIPNVVYRNDLLVECGLNPICRRLAANIVTIYVDYFNFLKYDLIPTGVNIKSLNILLCYRTQSFNIWHSNN